MGKSQYNISKSKLIFEKEWEQEYSGNIDMFDEILDIIYINKQEKEMLMKIYSQEASNIDNEIFSIFASEMLKELLEKLSVRARAVLILIYGLDNGQYRTHKEVSQMLGVDEKRIQEIERKALRNLKNLSTSVGLKDFLDDYEFIENEEMRDKYLIMLEEIGISNLDNKNYSLRYKN